MGTVGSPLILAATMFSTLNVESAVEFKVKERVDAGVANDKCTTTIPAITPVRSALGTELLAEETHAPVPTITRLYIYSNCINH